MLYAITAEQRDPLYAIQFSNPKNLKVLSAVDGLSGDMNVFRFIGNKKFEGGISFDDFNKAVEEVRAAAAASAPAPAKP